MRDKFINPDVIVELPNQLFIHTNRPFLFLYITNRTFCTLPIGINERVIL